MLSQVLLERLVMNCDEYEIQKHFHCDEQYNACILGKLRECYINKCHNNSKSGSILCAEHLKALDEYICKYETWTEFAMFVWDANAAYM